MSKGESDWLLLPSSPKGEIVGIMTKVLSLMATYSGDGSLYNRTVAEIDDQLSNIGENKEVRRYTLHKVRTRRPVLHKVRTYPQETHSLGAYPSAHIPRQLSAHTWGFLMVFSQQYWVIMVLIRGIDYFIIIIEPHDP